MKRTIICMLLVVAMCLGITSCAKEEPWQSDFLENYRQESLAESITEEVSQETESGAESTKKIREFYTLPWDFGDIYDIQMWGELLLVESSLDGETFISSVDIADGTLLAQVSLDTDWSVDIEICGDLIRLYKGETDTWVWLNSSLEEVGQYKLPFSWDYPIMMDADGTYLYYVDWEYNLIKHRRSDDEKVILENGFSKEDQPFLSGLLKNGDIVVIAADLYDDDGIICSEVHYIDTSSGQLLKARDDYSYVFGNENFYCTRTQTYGEATQVIFGAYDQTEIFEFVFSDYSEYEHMEAFPDAACVVTFAQNQRNQREFCLYSMDSGKKIAQYSMEIERDVYGYSPYPWMFTCEEENQIIAFTMMGDSSEIYVWNPIASVCMDETDYSRTYLSWDAEDEEMFSELRERAVNLGKEHGVHIYLGETCPVEYYGYGAQRTSSIRAVEHGLNIVEKALKTYPEGFFKQLTGTRGMLKICLVDALYPDGSDSLSTTTALFNYDSSSQMIVLSLSFMNDIEDLFYHEMSHAIDMKLYGSAYQYWTDEAWDALNPDGFLYDNSYVSNSQMFDSRYVWEWDNEAYFVDTYSKSFPTEDRARLMEYAMGKYPEMDCFNSEYLLAKLKHRSEAIRSAFDTTGWPDVTSWERPLIAD